MILYNKEFTSAALSIHQSCSIKLSGLHDYTKRAQRSLHCKTALIPKNDYVLESHNVDLLRNVQDLIASSHLNFLY